MNIIWICVGLFILYKVISKLCKKSNKESELTQLNQNNLGKELSEIRKSSKAYKDKIKEEEEKEIAYEKKRLNDIKEHVDELVANIKSKLPNLVFNNHEASIKIDLYGYNFNYTEVRELFERELKGLLHYNIKIRRYKFCICKVPINGMSSEIIFYDEVESERKFREDQEDDKKLQEFNTYWDSLIEGLPDKLKDAANTKNSFSISLKDSYLHLHDQKRKYVSELEKLERFAKKNHIEYNYNVHPMNNSFTFYWGD